MCVCEWVGGSPCIEPMHAHLPLPKPLPDDQLRAGEVWERPPRHPVAFSAARCAPGREEEAGLPVRARDVPRVHRAAGGRRHRAPGFQRGYSAGMRTGVRTSPHHAQGPRARSTTFRHGGTVTAPCPSAMGAAKGPTRRARMLQRRRCTGVNRAASSPSTCIVPGNTGHCYIHTVLSHESAVSSPLTIHVKHIRYTCQPVHCI